MKRNSVFPIAVTSKEQLERILTRIEQIQQANNPGQMVEVKVLAPDPQKVVFNLWDVEIFTISMRVTDRMENFV